MHDIRFIRDNPDAFDHALARRGLGAAGAAADRARRAAPRENPRARNRAGAPQRGVEGNRRGEEEQGRGEGQGIAERGRRAEGIDSGDGGGGEEGVRRNWTTRWREIPNLPLDEVPDGKDENDNVEHHRFGAKRDYAFTPKQHFDLGEALGQMDFETAAKLSGARFVVLKKGLARLERALGQFMLDVHTSEPHNYTEVAPPLLVRDEVMFGTAQLPKFRRRSVSWRRASARCRDLQTRLTKQMATHED